MLGEREPLSDPSETHGVCDRHAEEVREHVPSASFPGVRMLVVVAATERSLCRYLQNSFATVSGVQVIMDRRRGERRVTMVSVPVDFRRRERRVRVRATSPLGYQLVRFGAPPPAPGSRRLPETR